MSNGNAFHAGKEDGFNREISPAEYGTIKNVILELPNDLQHLYGRLMGRNIRLMAERNAMSGCYGEEIWFQSREGY